MVPLAKPPRLPSFAGHVDARRFPTVLRNASREPIGWDAGIYALVLRLRQPRSVVVGRLGRCRLPAGWYVYVGSAKRNLRARLTRHLGHEKLMHWHIDYLRVVAHVEQLWLWPWTDGGECRANRWVRTLSGATVPWKGFGSSDCNCVAHLTFFGTRPVSGDGKDRDDVLRTADALRVAGPGWAQRLTPAGKGRILPSRESAAQQRSPRDDQKRRHT